MNDHQSYYGHGVRGGVKPLRPNFEKLAAQGVEFMQNYSATPMCGPARRSFLTGLYPHTHGQVHNENAPPYRHEVYLDVLAEDGYRNFYYGKWHAGPGCAYDHHCDGLSQSGYGNPYSMPESMPKWPSTLLSVCPSNTAVAGCQGQDELLLYPLDIRPHPRYVLNMAAARFNGCRPE